MKVNEATNISIQDWMNYFWQMMMDFAIVSMAFSLMFCSAMIDLSGLAKKEQDRKHTDQTIAMRP